MSFWRRKKKKTRLDPDVLEATANDTKQLVRDQQPQIDASTTYLERRRLQNGFGEDFEYTLKPREAHP